MNSYWNSISAQIYLYIDSILLWFKTPKHFYNTLFKKFVNTKSNQLSVVFADTIFYLFDKTGILTTVLEETTMFLSIIQAMLLGDGLELLE